MADGTSKVTPSLFYQLYVIHALKGGLLLLEDGHLLPCLFLDILKREQDLLEVKQAFCISGRKPSKRKSNTDREKALSTLVDSYVSRPKLEFLRGIAYQFSLSQSFSQGLISNSHLPNINLLCKFITWPQQGVPLVRLWPDQFSGKSERIHNIIMSSSIEYPAVET